MTFLHPGWLWLLLLLPAVWVLPRPLWTAGDRRSLGVGGLRTLVLLLVILALARPVSVGDDGQPVHVVVADRSASMAALEGALDRARGVVDRTGDGAFLMEVGSGDASSLADALHRAAARIPDGHPGSITLLTDGEATDTRHGPVVQDLMARGVPVHVHRVAGTGTAPRLVGVQVHEPLRVGTTARLTLEIVGQGGPFRAVVRTPDGSGASMTVLAERSSLEVDGRLRVALEFEPRSAGFLPVHVGLLDDAGATLSDSQLRRLLAVRPPYRVLHVGARVQGAQDALQDLVGPGFEIKTLPRTPEAAGAALADADLVVVDDAPADAIPAPVQQEIVRRVRQDGLGMVMAGGRAAFGGGGWHKSAVADVLPVEFVQREEKRDPSTTLVVIIDTSGSMGGNRVQLAKEVARLAIRRLLPHDKVGIVEFFGAKRWAAPIQAASNSIEIERALNRLNAGGGTVIMPAIEEAFYGMQNVRTRYKHVLVLTDGGVETGAFEPLLRRMASRGINVSTVLIGPQAHSEFLVSLSNWGKGRFYNVPNRFNLPEILLKQPASARLPPYRPGTVSVEAQGGPGWWGDAWPGTGQAPPVPDLQGYVESRTKPGAQVVLRVQEKHQPLLASWRAGAGRTTALLTEPTGPGTRGWQDWPGYGPWLARVLARTAADRGEPYAFELIRDDGRLHLWARRQDAASPVPPPVAWHLVPGGEREALSFETLADGIHRATFRAPAGDDVQVEAGVLGDGGRPRVPLAATAVPDLVPERQVDPSRALDLEGLAQATGGEAISAEAIGAFRPRAGGGTAPLSVTAIWPWFVVLALLAWLGELWLRRMDGARSGGRADAAPAEGGA